MSYNAVLRLRLFEVLALRELLLEKTDTKTHIWGDKDVKMEEKEWRK